MPTRPTRPASSKRPTQSKKYNSGSLKTFKASLFRTLPMPIPRMLTFNASPLSPTKRRHSRHSRAAKKLQGLFRGHMARNMTKKMNSAAKKMQSFFRGRSARNKTGRMRIARKEIQQEIQQKKQAKLSREMAKLGLTAAPSTDSPRTTRSSRQLPSYRKNYKE